MQPPEKDELTERELDTILPAWKAPVAPARIRAAVFREAPMPWWRRMWVGSVRIPVPVAYCLAILVAVAAWQWITPRTIYRDRYLPAMATAGSEAGILRPVTELRARIIRSTNVQN